MACARGDIGLEGEEGEGEEGAVIGKGKDKKQWDVFVPHELLSAKTTFPLFVTVSPLSLSTTRSPLSFGILHHAKLYTTAFRGKYFENFLLPKSSWFNEFCFPCFYLFICFFFFFQSYRFNILIDKIEKCEQSSKFARFLNFNGFIISGFLSVATVKLKYDAILSDNFGRRIIFV